jgi:hypothetical protein
MTQIFFELLFGDGGGAVVSTNGGAAGVEIPLALLMVVIPTKKAHQISFFDMRRVRVRLLSAIDVVFCWRDTL